MRYCKRCVYPENHPLNLTFDEQGVCSGCRIHEEKDEIDWNKRSKKLGEIFDQFRSKSGKNYDCIIPVSGARDSYFIVDVVKNVYKMHPLLVTYNKQYNTKIGIRNLAYLKTLFGCDVLALTVSPDRVKKITKATLKNFGSIYWHCLAGQTVYPVQTAVRFKIPLIIWGAHQGNDQVGMYSHLDEVEMTRKYRKDHDVLHLEAEDLAGVDGLTKEDLRAFQYPSDKEIEKVGVRGIYLNNYMRWDSKAQHEKMIEKYGYETAKQNRTFDTYNDVDCFNYSDVHDYLKLIKWGYGKVSDHASRELRLKRLTREEAIDLVEKYQDVKPDEKNLKLFTDWLGITQEDFWSDAENYRNLDVWGKQQESWQLKDSVVNHKNDEGVDGVRLDKKEDCNFIITLSKDPAVIENEYILIGRGWVDGWKGNPKIV